MPSLPQDRVQMSKPFLNIGCDYIGPFHSRSGENMYICLYTCLTTRAVHLEVVDSLSAGAFLSSFMRFVSRRGVPQLVRTDCGSNFTLGSLIIKELFKVDEESGNSVMSYSACAGIKWLFNPPASPWMGGVWERLVGSVKKALRKSVGRKKLNFIELNTVATQIEAVINTRPLTKLNFSCLEEIPLRPVDFLQGNIKYSLPDSAAVNYSDDPSYDPELIQSRKQAYEALEFSSKVANKFWERWSKEYLTALRETQKNALKQPRHISRNIPEIGEIVLIEQDLLPRGNWSYGKVVEVIKSHDGGSRSAKVLIPNGKVLHRPLNKLYPLEIRSFSDSNDAQIPLLPHRSPEPAVDERNKRPDRRSKTRAIEIIKAFEDSLEDHEETAHLSQVQRPPLVSMVAKSPSSHRRSGISSLFMIALMLTAMSSAAAEQSWHTAIECMNGAVNIWPPNVTFKLCFSKECRDFDGATRKVMHYKLPVSPANQEVPVKMEFMHGNESLSMQTRCSPPSFCDQAKTILSIALLGNPHCWPVGALVTVAVILYLGLATAMSLFWGIKRLKRSEWRRTATKVPSGKPQQEIYTLHSFTPVPLSGRIVATVCIIALTTNNLTHACQNGYMRHSVDLICGPNHHCSHKFRREILFNTLQKEQCVEIRHRNDPVGYIKLSMQPM
ncbi:hypothetical protein Y032_1359g3845, partial [Ancylostoma ceylanicum]